MTTKRSRVSPRADPIRTDRAVAAVGIAAALVAAVAWQLDANQYVRPALCTIQLCSLLLLARWELEGGRGWATASFVVAGASTALLVVPSIVYTADPSLFEVGDLTGTIALVTGSTTAILTGYLIGARRGGSVDRQTKRLSLSPAVAVPWRAVAGYALGLLALVVVVMNAGGPLTYLQNLSKTLGLNAGLFYVIALLLLLRWVPAAITAQRWSEGKRAGRTVTAAFVVGTTILTLTGSRLFLAVAVLEVAIFWTLFRSAIPTRRIVVGGLIVGLAIVFGIGTVKRYQGVKATGQIGNQSFLNYATTTAPREVGIAYVNNYVDTVRLIGLAHNTVPKLAPYETFRPLEVMALKPLPSVIRPNIGRSPTITFVFATGKDTAYAMPIQATAILAGGPIVMLMVSLLIGMAVRAVDSRLLQAGSMPLWKFIGLVSLVVELPLMIRSGIPEGVAVGLTDVIGGMVAAWWIVRPVASESPEETVVSNEPASVTA